MSKTKFYHAWVDMKDRTTNDKYHATHRYKGRGIVVCEEWQDFMNFYNDMYESFLVHVEKYGKSNTSLDRMNNDMNYCPANCRWATRLEQCSNQGTNVYVVFRGVSVTIHQLARISGVGRKTLKYRIFKMGFSPEDAAQKKRFNSNKNANKARWGEAGPLRVEYKGKKYTLLELAKHVGMNYSTLRSRIHQYKWDVKRAVGTPIKKR